MRRENLRKPLVLFAISGMFALGCSNPNGDGGGAGGSTATPTGGASVGSGGGGPSGTGGRGTGGAIAGTGGRGTGGRGGANAGTGGAATGGALAATGGANADGGVPPTGDDCVLGVWPASDPGMAGPFATVTENEVGPQAGTGVDGGAAPTFTMFRPKDMKQGGLCHPVITWGNGTGSTPNVYRPLLNLFASHGFVVIASNSTNVAQGDPKPMIVGVTWVLEQNENPSSVLYHRIDTTHVAATGHSQGAVATSQAAGDQHITTNIPIEGAQVQRNLHGPSMFFCGGQDTLVGCTGAQSALAAVTTLPAMYAEFLSVDHGSWLSRTGKPSDSDTAFTAWMRVHLMGDTSLRSWFYGDACKLCTDSGWKIDRKNMSQ